MHYLKQGETEQALVVLRRHLTTPKELLLDMFARERSSINSSAPSQTPLCNGSRNQPHHADCLATARAG